MTRRDLIATSIAALSYRATAQKISGLPFASALTAAEAIRKRTISSVELTKMCFDRIRQFNPRINAIVVQLESEAMKRASEADAAVARRENWGPFHGVPITIKESFAIPGTPATWGLAEFKDKRSTFKAVAVERLERSWLVKPTCRSC
jgi:amidase